MKEKIVNLSNKKFLKLEINSINQKDKQFYIGNISARSFLDLYTVEPAEYDLLKHITFCSEFKDDEKYYEYLISEDDEKIQKKGFQRKLNPSRVKEISNFLNDEEYALFPNTIIVTCELINDSLNIDQTVKFEDLNNMNQFIDKKSSFSFLEEKNEKTYLYIPYVKKSILVIDGQHRICGLEQAEDQIINNYNLLLSFIIGYDRSTVAKLFYTINYTQKSVNKSLLYHLTGEFSRELNEITFMHETVKLLNELNYSPFFKRIKMLGKIPGELSSEEKRLSTVSQAFLIDYLANTISKNSIRSTYQPIFLYYFQQKEEQIEIIRFLIKYFSAIKKIKKQEWEDPSISIISKTIGIGAFIRVLHFFYIKLFIDEFEKDPFFIKKITIDQLIKKMGNLENIDFKKDGEFGGVGSAGSLNKLKERIVEKIVFFNATKYDDFLEDFKSQYFDSFKIWMNKNCKL